MQAPNNAQDTAVPKKTGRNMAIIAWIIGMALLTRFLGVWEEQQHNPNQDLASASSNEFQPTVSLERNRFGHYVFDGQINDQTVTFMIDTGATDIVIPQSLADELGLKVLGRAKASTANGVITVYKSSIKRLSIGPITLYNVSASINPSMNSEDYVLLGMSALKNLELRQKSTTLTLIQH